MHSGFSGLSDWKRQLEELTWRWTKRCNSSLVHLVSHCIMELHPYKHTRPPLGCVSYRILKSLILTPKSGSDKHGAAEKEPWPCAEPKLWIIVFMSPVLALTQWGVMSANSSLLLTVKSPGSYIGEWMSFVSISYC